MLVDNDEKRELREKLQELEDLEAQQAQERAEKNKDFIQLNRKNMDLLIQLTASDSVAAQVFLFLTKNMGRDNAVACSYKALQEALNLSKSTVYRAVKFLKDKKYIGVSNLGGARVYHLNADLVWSSWATGKQYALLRGGILLSKSEQEDLAKTKSNKVSVIDSKQSS